MVGCLGITGCWICSAVCSVKWRSAMLPGAIALFSHSLVASITDDRQILSRVSMKRTAALMSQLDWLHDSPVDVKVLSVWRDVGSFDDGFILNGPGKHLRAALQHPVNDLPGHLLTPLANDVVAVENRPRLVAADLHRDDFGRPGANQVPEIAGLSVCRPQCDGVLLCL